MSLFVPVPPHVAYRVGTADFDGTNDYMTTGASLTGASDSKSGILSCWIRIDGGLGAGLTVIGDATTVGGSTSRFNVLRTAGNVFQVSGRNAAGTEILNIKTATTYVAAATWLHLLASWNLATGAAHFYVNDVEDLAGSPTLTDDTLDYTVADWGIGGFPDGAFKLNGCAAEPYLAFGQFLDFSVEANRRKFIKSGGKPAYLGANGSKPTGVAPLVYEHLAKNEAVANFATNRGTGGNFTITGTLDSGSTSPSD